MEFEHNLTNMLIHLYNGKQCNEYIKEYKTILDSVSQFFSYQFQLIWTKKNFGLQSHELVIKFRNKIYDIVAQVRDKINKDAKDQGLISTVPKSGLDQSQIEIVRNQKTYTLHVTKYASEKTKYDEILSAIGEYFELFKNHTDLLEDLWIQLIGYLNLPNPSIITVFRKIHYQCYIKLVV